MLRLLARYAVLAAAVLVLNFLLPRALPGDPLDTAGAGLGPASATLTTSAREHLRASYHLDQPLLGQFMAYLNDLVHADLGWSISRAVPVRDVVGERLPWTLVLVLPAICTAALLGTSLGVLGAWRGDRSYATLISIATAIAGVPEFLVAMALLLMLGVGLGWFPLHGGLSPFGATQLPPPIDAAWHLALPGLSLVIASTAPFVLLAGGATRHSMRDPYVLTARAKGLSEPRVALEHVVPNALLPALTLFGIRIGHVLGGAIVVERVFALPGLGLLAVDAISARDYPVLQAIFLLGSVGVLLATFALELAYRWLGPRRGG